MEELKELVGKFQTLPYLFVGSGISRRYLDTDDWQGLLKHFVKQINPEALAYSNYKNRAKVKLAEVLPPFNTEKFLLPMVATLIEIDYNEKWFNSPDFKENRKAYGDLVELDISPFKIEVAEYIKNKSDLSLLKGEYSLEIDELKKIANRSINGVITTNYDSLIQNLFSEEKYNVYVGQENLIFSNLDGVRDIYKIHGCCSDPSSIILTYQDYVDYHNRNAYLAAKLTTIFVEHPIIFLGYSIEDANIISILQSIIDCLSDKHINQLTDRLFFVERSSVPGHCKVSDFTRQFGAKSIPMKKIELYDYSQLYQALKDIRAKYNPKLLNMLKRDIYDIIVSNKPSGKIIAVADINDKDIDKIDVVIGVGIKRLASNGIVGICAIDIFEDIVLNTFDFLAYDDLKQSFIDRTIPKELGSTGGSLPFYKYIQGISRDQLPEKVKNQLKSEYKQFFKSATLRKLEKNKDKYKDLNDVISKNDTLQKQLYEMIYLTEDKISLDQLEGFLIKTLNENERILEGGSIGSTDIRRLIKIYDWLKYKE